MYKHSVKSDVLLAKFHVNTEGPSLLTCWCTILFQLHTCSIHHILTMTSDQFWNWKNDYMTILFNAKLLCIFVKTVKHDSYKSGIYNQIKIESYSSLIQQHLSCIILWVILVYAITIFWIIRMPVVSTLSLNSSCKKQNHPYIPILGMRLLCKYKIFNWRHHLSTFSILKQRN